jgi:hypothetical protein
MKSWVWWLVVLGGLYVLISSLVKFKPGVPSDGVQWQTWLGINVAAAIRAALGGGDTTIAATTNGAHMTDSLHYQGFAADLRAHDLAAALQETWFQILRAALSPFGYDVLLEDEGTANAHIHIEYDPKAGRSLA